jgi:RNA methyltransferase, TrmH family
VPGTGATVLALGPGVAERVAATDTTPGLFAIVRSPTPDPSVLGRAGFVVVADRVGNPGNLGTILRSAEAAGVEVVVVTPGTVDVFNPKVVRASAGALFHVPVLTTDLASVRQAGLRLVGTSSHRGTPHVHADWTGRLAIVAGSESHGLDEEPSIDEWVRIEHTGRAESLNVAMAVTVICFEAIKRRRHRLSSPPC